MFITDAQIETLNNAEVQAHLDGQADRIISKKIQNILESIAKVKSAKWDAEFQAK